MSSAVWVATLVSVDLMLHSHCINFFLINTFDGFWNTLVLSFFNVLCFLLVADIDGNTFWSHPFNSLCHPKQLEEFIVMECSIVRDIKRSAGAGMISKKVSSILFTFLYSWLIVLVPLSHSFFFKFVSDSKMWFQISWHHIQVKMRFVFVCHLLLTRGHCGENYQTYTVW